MRFKCIKTIAYHWGMHFEEGKIYESSSIIEGIEYEMISNIEEYLGFLKKVTKNIPEVTDLLSKKDPESKIRLEKIKESSFFIALDDINIKKSEKYLFKVKLNTIIINGNLGDKHFCLFTHKELLDKYGTDCFHTSVYLLEDYFDPIDLIRDKKILLKKYY